VNQRGSVSIFGLLAVFAATSVLLTAVILFATGIAQNAIIPRLKARAEEAPQPAASEAAEPEARGEAAVPVLGGGMEADSLRAVRMQVKLEQEQLAARTAELQAAMAEWKAKQQTLDAEAAKRVAALAKVYSSMKPEAAARVLMRLDDATFEQVLAKLDKRQAGKILALIDPERMARLTQQAAQTPVEAGL
jgi:flagellar motility protein MotE (MotC chaperone)